jgi:hypothetical protein
MKIKLYIILLIALCGAVKAQQVKPYAAIDKLALQIPDSLAKTTKGIAGYIKSNFTSSNDKARAIFIWVATNIQYDVANMYAINFYQNVDEIVDTVMKKRRGICMHFAELFNRIANEVGLKSYVVEGYTKQNGIVDYIPHAWCAAMIDSNWFLFDPTWGSGFIQNAKFVKQVNNKYFKAKPEQLVKSHMPFDPLWEFLNYPITNQEFYEGKTQVNSSKLLFSCLDTLKAYETLTDHDKLVSSTRRIEANGVKNSIIFDRVQHNKREIEYLDNKKVVETHNSKANQFNHASAKFNLGIALLNEFINYRNQKFNPKKTDSQIKLMLDTVEILFNQSKAEVESINAPDGDIVNLIQQFNRSFSDGRGILDQQEAFLKKYLNAWKPMRSSMF